MFLFSMCLCLSSTHKFILQADLTQLHMCSPRNYRFKCFISHKLYIFHPPTNRGARRSAPSAAWIRNFLMTCSQRAPVWWRKSVAEGRGDKRLRGRGKDKKHERAICISWCWLLKQLGALQYCVGVRDFSDWSGSRWERKDELFRQKSLLLHVLMRA